LNHQNACQLKEDETMNLEELVKDIQSNDPQTRTTAWQQAGSIGAPAVKPLVKLYMDKDMEVRRAAKRGLEKIVRTVGTPGAERAKSAVIKALLGLLGDSQPVALRRDILWLLSEIAGAESIESIAALLRHDALREDARMVLERIPGDRSLAALRHALGRVPEDFRLNIAQSLRARGESVSLKKYPCQKLVPTK
jgi:HEAT repeat protein